MQVQYSDQSGEGCDVGGGGGGHPRGLGEPGVGGVLVCVWLSVGVCNGVLLCVWVCVGVCIGVLLCVWVSVGVSWCE